MTGKIRVLIVDDAVVVRRMISKVLSDDPMLEVVGAAANGRIALAKIPQLNPDLITLDVEMPEMDGLETLAEIRKGYPRLPVIMFSTPTERGAVATLNALSLGASDYVTKPANAGCAAGTMQQIRDTLIPKIKALRPCAQRAEPRRSTIGGETKPFLLRSTPSGRVDILTVGVSTGGPNALSAFLGGLPADFPIPTVIVQHMPPMFTKLLADRLSARTALHVSEGKAGAILHPGQVWIAPGNYHMVVRRENGDVRLAMNQAPPENSCRPSVDVLFRSVAETFGEHTLAIVMTGMGRDGLRGCEDIHEAGGRILVQDEATSVVWGMPGFVASAGLAEKILPLELLHTEVVHRVLRRVSPGAQPFNRTGISSVI